jgi:uncharacterized protein (UPF0548 family)
MVEQAADKPLTYTEVGATRTGTYPAGAHSANRSIILGSGKEVFERGKEAIRTWQSHRAAGATLVPDNPRLEVGTNLVAVVRQGPLFVVVPCRIVYVTADANRFGFGYGTLAGHPESGEESFHVEIDHNDRVTFSVRFFSRLVDPLARVGAPLAWELQRRVTQRYLRGVRAFVGH